MKIGEGRTDMNTWSDILPKRGERQGPNKPSADPCSSRQQTKWSELPQGHADPHHLCLFKSDSFRAFAIKFDSGIPQNFHFLEITKIDLDLERSRSRSNYFGI